MFKDHKVDLNVKDHYGYQVSGNLPEDMPEGFVLANLIAHSSPDTCITEKKWLFKVEQQKPVEVEEVKEVVEEIGEAKTNGE